VSIQYPKKPGVAHVLVLGVSRVMFPEVGLLLPQVRHRFRQGIGAGIEHNDWRVVSGAEGKHGRGSGVPDEGEEVVGENCVWATVAE